MSLKDLELKYVLRDIFQEVRSRLEKKENEFIELSQNHARTDQDNAHLREKLTEQKKELEEMKKIFQLEFENLANKLLEDKSRKFLEINEKNLYNLLNPLKEKIQDFEKKVEETHKEEIMERVSLKKELEQIIQLNQQVSEDAKGLTNALKGDSRLQGSWGEVQLELILNKAGLEEGIHYARQISLTNESGGISRPDYIIYLPEKKCLILDSKVSLVAYERYFNSEERERKNFLKEHLASLYRHIDNLSGKNYPQLYGIRPPDYVFMFIPLEPALLLAFKEDPRLFEKSPEKNVALVSVSTLLAMLRTISYIWKQENQKRNVVKIAQESGKLYDKFVAFLTDLSDVGGKLDEAKNYYDKAMNKLTTSTKKADTIIGRMERIKH